MPLRRRRTRRRERILPRGISPKRRRRIRYWRVWEMSENRNQKKLAPKRGVVKSPCTTITLAEYSQPIQSVTEFQSIPETDTTSATQRYGAFLRGRTVGIFFVPEMLYVYFTYVYGFEHFHVFNTTAGKKFVFARLVRNKTSECSKLRRHTVFYIVRMCLWCEEKKRVNFKRKLCEK